MGLIHIRVTQSDKQAPRSAAEPVAVLTSWSCTYTHLAEDVLQLVDHRDQRVAKNIVMNVLAHFACAYAPLAQ